MKRQNWLLLLGVVILAAGPLLWIRPATKDAEIFTGSDDQAEHTITATRPDYKRWFVPVWEPPSAEIESLLFGVQAAIGAGALAYCLGYYRGKGQAAKDHAAPR